MGRLDAGPAAGFAQPSEVPSHWTPSPHQDNPEQRASAEIMLPSTSENNNKHTMVMWHKMAFCLITDSCYSPNTQFESSFMWNGKKSHFIKLNHNSSSTEERNHVTERK